MPQRKFDNMESVLQTINARYIQLSQEKVTKNRIILEHVLSVFEDEMRALDPLFDDIFYDVFYGGSFYDDLKIGKPDEFDLDFLMDIGNVAEVKLETSNVPGFMHLKLLKLKDRNNPQISRKVVEFCDRKNYFITENILIWWQSIVQRVFNGLPRLVRNVGLLTTPEGTFKITFNRSGPAVTLHVFTLDGEDYYEDDDDDEDDYFKRSKVMSIDLVPCFTFRGWPQHGFNPNPYAHFTNDKFLSRYFLVPKEPKHSSFGYTTRYWRSSFQAQERKLMDNKNRLKQTIRLLKKLRNRFHDDKIASYYIKTVLFHIIDQKRDDFWDLSLSKVFMTVLKEYVECIRKGEILFYWYPRYNLICKVSSATLENIYNRLTYMIKDIEDHPEKPETVAKYLLTPKTFQRFMEVGPVPAIEENNNSSSCIIL